MGGRVTNILVGISNMALGLVLLAYEYVTVENAISFSKYQNQVMGFIKYGVYTLIILNVLFNLVYAYYNRGETKLRNSYLLMVTSLVYIFYSHYIIAALPIVVGLLVIFSVINKNFIEAENNISIVISILLIITHVFMAFGVIGNSYFANIIKRKDQAGLQKMDENFFQIVEPLSEEKYQHKFINIKKGDKFGYINEKAETVISFDYDFATPFYEIVKNNRVYRVAGFTKGDITEIVLKNARVIMSYKSEKEIYDYKARIDEFIDVVKKEFKVEEVTPEIRKTDNYYIKKKIYNEIGEKQEGKTWTARYDFNPIYDLLVTESVFEKKFKYELAEKENLDKRIVLDAERLIHDDKYLYVFKGDYIPYFNPSEKIQGYFEPTGNRWKLEGRAKILYVKDDKILLENTVKKVVYFKNVKTGKDSPMFKDVIVDERNNRYIVKDNNNKWSVLNNKLEKIFEQEFDVFKTDLMSEGIYIFANLPEKLEFNQYNYVKIEYLLADLNGNALATNINFFYDVYDKFSKKEMTEDDNHKFREELQSVKMNSMLDKYYTKMYSK